MNINSTRYTIVFATIVCVACALLVSAAAVTLQPRQKANARLYMEKNVLIAAGLVKPGEAVDRQQVDRLFQSEVKARLIDFATGELVADDRIDARDYDQRAARNDPGASSAAPPNNAGIGRMPARGVVYFVQKNGEIEQVVIPIEGLGMWGTMYGFMALGRDGNSVRGLTYYEHKETPGLGGEISSPAWLRLWQGRKAYDEQGLPRITVIKGAAGTPDKDPLKVDGMSGATITSNAVTRLTHYWLSDDGYGRFLKKFRQGAAG